MEETTDYTDDTDWGLRLRPRSRGREGRRSDLGVALFAAGRARRAVGGNAAKAITHELVTLGLLHL